MSTVARLLSCACLAVALLAPVSLLWPWLFGGDLAALGRSLVGGLRRAEALDARARAMLQCLDGKREVTDRVIRGKVGLHEAARHFRELEREARADDPDREGVPGPAGESSADHQAACRNVIRWVSGRLRKAPPATTRWSPG